jgi:hypothetical protein
MREILKCRDSCTKHPADETRAVFRGLDVDLVLLNSVPPSAYCYA